MIQEIKTHYPDIVAAEFSGNISDGDIKELFSFIDDGIKNHHQINLYMIVDDVSGTHLDVNSLDFPNHFGNALKKVAIVGDPAWTKLTKDLVGKLQFKEVKYFDPPGGQAAWEWLVDEYREHLAAE